MRLVFIFALNGKILVSHRFDGDQLNFTNHQFGKPVDVYVHVRLWEPAKKKLLVVDTKDKNDEDQEDQEDHNTL